MKNTVREAALGTDTTVCTKMKDATNIMPLWARAVQCDYPLHVRFLLLAAVVIWVLRARYCSRRIEYPGTVLWDHFRRCAAS